MRTRYKDGISGNQYHRELIEKDFYPPSDDRILKSYVKDIYNGDNFANYCEYIFDILDEEEYWD